ncbi:DASH complex subunit Spc19, partial [Protomyces lactucae-debilis]
LEGCVASLRASCTTLQNSLDIFHDSIADFPRLHTVLANTRHFELLPESHVLAAQRELVAEIGPLREELLGRAQKWVTGEERREQGLKSKVALNKVRLQSTTSSTSTSASASVKEASGHEAAGQAERAERMRLLRAKKARLQ